MNEKPAHLKISGPEVEYNVEEVYQIHEVVKTEPDHYSVGGDFGKAESEYDDPKVVEKSHRDYHGPVVTQPSGRVEHKRPVTSEGTEQYHLSF